MANGKGTLDCYYCQHRDGDRCSFHEVRLPSYSNLNRVCCHFQANQQYSKDNGEFFPPARKFTWFGKDFEPGILYFFEYNSPNNIEKSVVLRKPDYQNNRWAETPRS